MASGMRDSARDAALILERGAERYALGDVKGAAVLWREALAIAPDDLRTRAYLDWAEACLAPHEPSPAEAEDQALSQALSAGLIADVEADPFGARFAGPFPSLADASDSEPTSARQANAAEFFSSSSGESAPPQEEPTIERRTTGPAEDENTSVYRLGQPWNEPTPVTNVVGGEAERDFFSRVPTNPDLAPLDVPELTDDMVAMLAEAAGVRPSFTVLPAPPSPNAPRVVEIDAEPEGESPATDDMVVIEMEAEDADPAEAQAEADAEAEAHDAPPEKTLSRHRPVAQLVAAARGAVDRGDYEGAFVAAERLVLAVGGIDAPELIAHSKLLGQIYEQQLGDLERTVIVAAIPQKLDPRAAFLLSRVDGMLTLGDLHDVSGMPWLEAIRLVAVMLRQGALALR